MNNSIIKILPEYAKKKNKQMFLFPIPLSILTTFEVLPQLNSKRTTFVIRVEFAQHQAVDRFISIGKINYLQKQKPA